MVSPGERICPRRQRGLPQLTGTTPLPHPPLPTPLTELPHLDFPTHLATEKLPVHLILQTTTSKLLQLLPQPPTQQALPPSRQMAQGTIKKLGRAAPVKATHSKRQASKVAKPKKGKTTVDKAHKKFTSGMAARTEAMLGERAGHLEIIGKGKKGKDKKAVFKGGSKKFG